MVTFSRLPVWLVSNCRTSTCLGKNVSMLVSWLFILMRRIRSSVVRVLLRRRTVGPHLNWQTCPLRWILHLGALWILSLRWHLNCFCTADSTCSSGEFQKNPHTPCTTDHMLILLRFMPPPTPPSRLLHTHPSVHSLSFSLTHSLTYSFTFSLTHSLTHSLARLLAHSSTFQLTHLRIYSLTHTLIILLNA